MASNNQIAGDGLLAFFNAYRDEAGKQEEKQARKQGLLAEQEHRKGLLAQQQEQMGLMRGRDARETAQFEKKHALDELKAKNDYELGMARLNADRAKATSDRKTSDKTITQDQRAVAGYSTRAETAHGLLGKMEKDGKDIMPMGRVRSAIANVGEWVSPGFSNSMMSDDEQTSDQAQRNFLLAVIRPESGATITPPEMEEGKRIYFPVTGDGPEVIENKRQARMQAIASLKARAGDRAISDIGGSQSVDQSPREKLIQEIKAARALKAGKQLP